MQGPSPNAVDTPLANPVRTCPCLSRSSPDVELYSITGHCASLDTPLGDPRTWYSEVSFRVGVTPQDRAGSNSAGLTMRVYTSP